MKNQLIEAEWKKHSEEEQERLADTFEEYAKRGFSPKEALLYVVKIGICGPGDPTRFCPTLNARIHASMKKHMLIGGMRGLLRARREKALERCDDFEANYFKSLTDNYVRDNPKNSWLVKPPDR